MSDGDRVTGSYGYLGPDGIFRHVDYTADENGFRAKIRTSEPGTSNANPANVEIESNPVRVVQPSPQGGGSSGTSGANYDGLNPDNAPAINQIQGGGGIRGDGLRPPDRTINRDNPDRNTYSNRPPSRPSIPRIPDPSGRTEPPLPDINRGSDVSRPRSSNPNIDNPNLIRGGPPTRNRDRNYFGEAPDDQIPANIIPYRGANPKRPVVDSPRGGPGQGPNEFDNRNLGPNFRGNQDVNSLRDPNYNRDRVTPSLPPPPPTLPPPQPFDRGYGRDGDRGIQRKQDIPIRNPAFDDNRGSTVGSTEGPNRGYEAQKGGPNRPTNFGFIEATKGIFGKDSEHFK